MQFMKEGAYFDHIEDAREFFCDKKCLRCKLAAVNNGEAIPCWSFCDKHKRKAAELMGFDVVEDEKEKTQIPDNIGSMTLAQAKEYCSKWAHEHGYPCKRTGCELKRRHICMDWVHEWDFDRLTPQELEICSAVGAKWISKDMVHTKSGVELRKEKPTRDDHGEYVGGYVLAAFDVSLFPSVKPGDCICVEDLIKEAENGT